MTTVAYKDGRIAADSLISTNTRRIGSFEKIRKFTDWQGKEYLAGAAGVSYLIQQFFDHLERYFNKDCELKMPNSSHIHGGDFEAFFVCKDEPNVINGTDGYGLFDKIHADEYCIGSGARLAIGALAMGATVEKAVETGIRFDTGSGGDIRVLEFTK